MDESQNNYAERMELGKKRVILLIGNSRKCTLMYNDRKEISDCLKRPEEQKGWEEGITKDHKELFGIMTCLIS